MLPALATDAVAALRTIRRRPGAYLGALALLALGVGAVTLVFSLVRGVLLEPLPFPEPDRLVSIWERSVGSDPSAAPRREKNVVSPANFLDWREQASTIESMAAFVVASANLTEVGDPRRVRLGLVTEGFFETLEVEAELGRLFAPEEMVAGGGRPTAVLSHGLWRTVFGADPEVLGRRVRVDGRDHEVIGVVPPGIEIDMGEAGGSLGRPADLWAPLPITDQWSVRRGRWLLALGRLAPGVGLDAARAELDTIAQRLADEHPDFNEGWGVTVDGLHDHVVSTVRPTLVLLLGAVILVLVVVCANATSLLLTRAAERSSEMRVRGALGAERGRLVRLVLVESMTVFVVGGALGVAWAGLALRALDAWVPASVPRLGNVGLDLTVVAVAVAVALVAGLASGLVPALQSAEASGLGARRALGRALPRFRSLLVGAQVALALVLLVAGGAMLQAVHRQLAVDPGFRSEGLLTFSLSLPRQQYQEPAALDAFWDALLEGLESLPGVRSAGAVSYAPLSGMGAATGYHPADRPEPPPGESVVTDVRVVAGDFHRTLGIPLLEGRLFDERDHTPGERRPVVVSRALAEEAWPGRSALGRELVVSWGGPEKSVVIGVVGDVHYESLTTAPRAALYWPIELDPALGMTVSVAAEGDPDTLAPRVRAAVAAVDPEVPIESLRTLDEVVRDSVSRQRFALQVVAIFGVAALLLAAVGLYGAMALLVRSRQAEIGLRLALGAAPRAVAGAVVARALRLVGIGLLVGAGAAAAAARWMSASVAESLLAGGRALDATVLDATVFDATVVGAASGALLLAALLAAAPAALRAARLDPATTLRDG